MGTRFAADEPEQERGARERETVGVAGEHEIYGSEEMPSCAYEACGADKNRRGACEITADAPARDGGAREEEVRGDVATADELEQERGAAEKEAGEGTRGSRSTSGGRGCGEESRGGEAKEEGSGRGDTRISVRIEEGDVEGMMSGTRRGW